MSPALHLVDCPGPGRLATMPHPRGGWRLPGELAALARAGVDVLVSALTEDERRRLGLLDAATAAAAAGVEFVSFPVPDRGLPDRQGMLRLAVRLAAHIRAGRFVVVHCFGGIGRATLLAGATLAVLGIGPDAALRRLTDARGLPVPDNEWQRQWLYDFADGLRRRAD